MIKMLTACGAGVNSSHQIKDAVETEMKNRGYDVSVNAQMIKDVNPDMMKGVQIFLPINHPDLGFDISIPEIDAGAILYRMPAMAKPVYDKIEEEIKKIQ
ncbi:PTS fructose transporter subunit IIB [Pediococcus stilesii]|uniref:PTS fructose transporter subunit IIB n=1 Tax=Pediococcus stilesii TaxID=331679 RepID=A0A0R2KUK3_9LACO|nr:PTS fructose transporter subunit IIB [Pediococcus stilesii]KRN93120.1 PTS system IIB component (galactitol fructose specific) [Pediococcus stilesii]TLQ03300.1 PTS fructose transporter subunit IIB [Pediococcus stilesii]